MRISTRLIAAVLLFTSSSLIAYAQQIRFDDSGPTYHLKLQSDLKRIIAFRDITDPNLAAVRAVSSSGSNVSIFPLKDFPGSTYIDVWDATGAPDGGVVVAAILAYGPRNVKPIPVKSLLLTYDETGILRRVWDVKPYHLHLVAADSGGNVFALGDGGAGDYPLLIKYSPTGEVIGEFLSSGLFEAKDHAIDMNSPNGQAQLFLENGHLNVWIAATRELYVFSLDGATLSTISLSGAVQSITQSTGATHVSFFDVHVDSNQRITTQVRLLTSDRKQPVVVGLARLQPNGSFDSWIEPPARGDVHKFIGLAADDKPLFLEKVGGRAVAIHLSQ